MIWPLSGKWSFFVNAAEVSSKFHTVICIKETALVPLVQMSYIKVLDFLEYIKKKCWLRTLRTIIFTQTKNSVGFHLQQLLYDLQNCPSVPYLTKCRHCKLPPPFQVDDGYRAECTSLALSLPGMSWSSLYLWKLKLLMPRFMCRNK